MPFWQFLRNWLIGWIGHALLVQPSISAHRKWPEMVVSASTNQVWTKITIRSYAWSFAIQIQIQAVWFVHAHLMVQQFKCNCVRKCVCGCVSKEIFYFDHTFHCKHMCGCRKMCTMCVQVRPKINTQQFPCSFQIFTRYLWDIRSMKVTYLVETQVPIGEEFSFKKYFFSLWTFLKWTCLPWTSIDLDPNFDN